MKKLLLITLMLILTVATSYAQRPGRPDVTNLVAIEKDSVLAKIPNLSEDQKMLITSIYTDYSASLKKLRENRDDDRENFRAQLLSLSQEKNKLMKETLNEEQYQVFTDMLAEARKQRQDRRKGMKERREKRGRKNTRN